MKETSGFRRELGQITDDWTDYLLWCEDNEEDVEPTENGFEDYVKNLDRQQALMRAAYDALQSGKFDEEMTVSTPLGGKEEPTLCPSTT